MAGGTMKSTSIIVHTTISRRTITIVPNSQKKGQNCNLNTGAINRDQPIARLG
jgi:hypothetical protein